MKSTSSVADSFSEIGVKPRTSMNITVISRASPPSSIALGELSSRASNSGARYCPNACRTNFFSLSDATRSVRSIAIYIVIAASDG